MGLRCKFCGKDWVQGCWTEREAYGCGNNDGSVVAKLEPVPLPKRLQAQIDRQSAKLARLQEKAIEYRITHPRKS